MHEKELIVITEERNRLQDELEEVKVRLCAHIVLMVIILL